jgi:hypothetical protein
VSCNVTLRNSASTSAGDASTTLVACVRAARLGHILGGSGCTARNTGSSTDRSAPHAHLDSVCTRVCAVESHTARAHPGSHFSTQWDPACVLIASRSGAAVAAQHGATAAHITPHSMRIATVCLHASAPLGSHSGRLPTLGHTSALQHRDRGILPTTQFVPTVELLRTMSGCVATRESSDGYRRRHELSTRRRSDGRAVVALGILVAVAVVLTSVGGAGVCSTTSRRAAVCTIYACVWLRCACGRCARHARQRPSVSRCPRCGAVR